MSAPPLLSVITPSYNYSRYLEECLLSVRRQSRKGQVEHIVVDDGSTDDSWDVIQRVHLDPSTRAVQTNSGLASCLNRALGMATGQWVLWLNADDYLLPHAVDVLAEMVRRHPDADLVFGDTVFVDDQSAVIRLATQPRFTRSLLQRGYNTFHVPSVAWRRAAAPSARVDETMKLLMDLDLWLSLTPPGTVVIKADAAISAFRRHTGQISHTDRPSDLDELHTIGKHHDLPRLQSASRVHSGFPVRAAHAILKLRDGGRGRERQFARHAGRPADWVRGTVMPGGDVDPLMVKTHRSVVGPIVDRRR